MALTQQRRAEIIKHLTANADAWKSPGDDKLLAGFGDEKLEQLLEACEEQERAYAVANAAVKGFSHGGHEYKVDEELGEWVAREVANSDELEDAEDDSGEEEDPDAAYRDRKNAQRMAGKGKAPATKNSARRRAPTPPPDEDDDLDDYRPAPRPQTLEELARQASPEVRNRLERLSRYEQDQKDQVIERLLVNVLSPAAKQAHYARLNARELDDLKMELDRMGPQRPPEEEAPTKNSRGPRFGRQQDDADDMLALPTSNWEKVDNKEAARQESAPAASWDEDVSDDDYIANAPPSVRRMLEEARNTRDTEKKKLVAELIQNAALDNDDEERQMAYDLKRKSVEDLRIMHRLSAAAAGRAARTPPPRFGGAGSPAVNVGRPPSDATEDLLPLPSYDYSQKQAN